MLSPNDSMVGLVDLCKRFTKGKETITISGDQSLTGLEPRSMERVDRDCYLML